jgi:hypothetical protein
VGVILLWVGVFPRESRNPVRVPPCSMNMILRTMNPADRIFRMDEEWLLLEPYSCTIAVSTVRCRKFPTRAPCRALRSWLQLVPDLTTSSILSYRGNDKNCDSIITPVSYGRYGRSCHAMPAAAAWFVPYYL